MRRTTTIAVLSVTALVAMGGSSASALTWSPSSFDYGRVPIRKSSPPQTFTLTKDPNLPFESAGPEFFIGRSSSRDEWQVGKPSTCLEMAGAPLTTATPSCTVTISFTPITFGGRTLESYITSTQYGTPIARLSGDIVLRCRTKTGKTVRVFKRNCNKGTREL